MSETGAYYDHLARFLDLARWVRRDGGAAHAATHRFLAGHDDDVATPDRLDRLILDAAREAGLQPSPRVLDAGCGLGGTIFRWHDGVGGHYDGLTLSPEQCRRAEAEADRRGIGATCRFHVRDYHHRIAGRYNAVIAIESLAHSPDPTGAIANLAAALDPGGLFLIVDDMPAGSHDAELLASFKAHWRCPVLPDAAGFRAALSAAGLRVVREIDLTGRLRPRPRAWLRLLIATFGMARRLA
ncbi:MAG: class I SAM-dependent methyltransferase, partial [Rhodospirillaceae bacterium]|nr:class I SAM-dependent methyltransferase [Rhodospirillaceae bacterium]